MLCADLLRANLLRQAVLRDDLLRSGFLLQHLRQLLRFVLPQLLQAPHPPAGRFGRSLPSLQELLPQPLVLRWLQQLLRNQLLRRRALVLRQVTLRAAT